MPPHRSYLNAVTRDPDTMNNMAAPGPPGPLMTDEHDGAVNDVPVALTSNNSTAHILDQINPSINPYSLNNDALVKDLGHRVDVEQHGNMNDATTITSSASRRLHNLQLNKHSEQMINNLIQQKGDDKLKNVIDGIANTFKSCASIAYSADILKFKTVLDEATSSAKPSTPDHSLPDIRNLQHQITKIQGIHVPANTLTVSA